MSSKSKFRSNIIVQEHDNAVAGVSALAQFGYTFGVDAKDYPGTPKIAG